MHRKSTVIASALVSLAALPGLAFAGTGNGHNPPELIPEIPDLLATPEAESTPPPAAEPCAGQTFEKAFAAFNDHRDYTLAPNGSFESGTDGWVISDGVEVRSHQNPHRPDPGASALYMPGGSTVTSPLLCVAKGYPSARLFAQTLAGKGASMSVSVIYPNATGGNGKPPKDKPAKSKANRAKPAAGGAQVKPAGNLPRVKQFGPTRSFSLAQGRFKKGAAADGSTQIRLRFTAKPGSEWLIDDLLIDPRRH